MAQPAIDYYVHPVFDPNRLHLRTPAMQALSDELHRWLWTGATGGLVAGSTRVGKTRALLALASTLVTRGNQPIPVCYASMPKRDQPTILSVFRQLCWNANLRVTNHDRADHLADRFVHYLADQAVEKTSRQVVLLVDEMQRLTPTQFNAFAELYDKLLLLDINLMVVFAGNDPACWERVEAMEQPAYAHIHGRFFTQGFRFMGLSSKADVTACLAQYDHLRYPADGPTYTEFFLPEAVKKGWCLASLSGDIWGVFRDHQKAYQIESWGMQFFTATINTLLTDFLPQQGVMQVNADMLQECIRVSGLIPSLVRPEK